MQLSLSDLNLVYACTRDKTLMIDVQAREISEKDLEAGLRLAHPEVSHETCNDFVRSLYFWNSTKKLDCDFRQLSLLNLKSNWLLKLVSTRRHINCQ